MRRALPVVSLLVLISLSPAVPSISGEPAWPVLQHNTAHTGWDGSQVDGTLTLAWHLNLSEAILASPAVADGQLYVGTLEGELVSLALATGTVQWSKSLDDGPIISSPVLSHGQVIAASTRGPIHSLDQETGEVLWRSDVGDNLTASPTLWEGSIFVHQDDDTIRALSLATGEERWRFDTLQPYTGGNLTFARMSSPIVLDDMVVVGSNDAGVYALDANTGELQWRFDTYIPDAVTPGIPPDPLITTVPDNPVAASPATDGSLILAATGRGQVYALDPGTGAMLWKYETPSPTWLFFDPTVTDGQVIFNAIWDHNITSLDTATGEILWQHDLEEWLQTSPAAADGYIYAGTDTRDLRVIDTSTGTLVTNISLPGDPAYFQSPPVIADGCLVQGASNGHLYVLDVGTCPAMPDGDASRDQPENRTSGAALLGTLASLSLAAATWRRLHRRT